jgi:hypothetical protein
MLPKTVVDVKQCEISRFLVLGAQNEINTVSFFVPRRVHILLGLLEDNFFSWNNLSRWQTSDTLYQEDLYPPCAVGKPACSADGWFSGKTVPPVLVNLRPEGVVSVFEVFSKKKAISFSNRIVITLGV